MANAAPPYMVSGDFVEPHNIDGREIGPALEGYSREDCRAFRGDSKCAPLTWTGGERCPRGGLLLRFHLRRARLYGFEWR